MIVVHKSFDGLDVSFEGQITPEFDLSDVSAYGSK